MVTENNDHDHFERLRVVRYRDLVRLGLFSNRVTLARWIAAGKFPPPIKLGPNIRCWRLKDIEGFLEDAAKESLR
jgi:predicted DNA-binding transcriptional regulator AlpA